MASRLLLHRFKSHLLRYTTTTTTPFTLLHSPTKPKPKPISLFPPSRFLSTFRPRNPSRQKPVDIGARARQLQTRRLWTYALTFSCVAGFMVIVLNGFQDQLVFYVTPTDAMEKFKTNPERNRFRLGGLVLEGSVVQPASSAEMEFVITDLVTDILVRYKGSLPDLFREGHSVVVEGFVKPFEGEGMERRIKVGGVSEKAWGGECYFSAVEVLAKHDEKYMPKEVAEAIEKNKRTIEAAGGGGGSGMAQGQVARKE